MQPLDTWLNQYSESHRHPANQILHKICVPLIFFSIFGILWELQIFGIPAARILAIAGMVFYFRLGWKPAALMLAQLFVTFVILSIWSQKVESVVVPSTAIFILAWIGQFVGHKIEGAKPSFFQDLQFLFIGPLWVFYQYFRKS